MPHVLYPSCAHRAQEDAGCAPTAPWRAANAHASHAPRLSYSYDTPMMMHHATKNKNKTPQKAQDNLRGGRHKSTPTPPDPSLPPYAGGFIPATRTQNNLDQAGAHLIHMVKQEVHIYRSYSYTTVETENGARKTTN